MAKSYKSRAVNYAKEVIAGKRIEGNEVLLACERFINDSQRKDLTLRTKDADFVIGII